MFNFISQVFNKVIVKLCKLMNTRNNGIKQFKSAQLAVVYFGLLSLFTTPTLAYERIISATGNASEVIVGMGLVDIESAVADYANLALSKAAKSIANEVSPLRQ